MPFTTNQDFLTGFGWTRFFSDQVTPAEADATLPARVIGVEKDVYRVQTDLKATHLAGIPGRRFKDSKSGVEFPAVGDWVLVTPSGREERLTIQRVLERRTLLSRKRVASRNEMQIIATNIDTVFITSSLNQDFNIPRIERYLGVARQSGATPVVLLTKLDLCEDIEEKMRALRLRMGEANILALSVFTPESLAQLQPWIRSGTTSVFIGSSGVGKSTLLNTLIEREVLKTQDIRAEDGRGRHTTTSRYLYTTTMGGQVIDTPGMREIQLFDEDHSVDEEFGDLGETMLQCRFTDCAHLSEPGCAIQLALKNKTLSADRWANYLQIQKENKYVAGKKNRPRR